MVDFRKSGVSKGGLGIYSATKSLTSPASSSLDKPAGTLSKKTTADLATTGAAAQQLIQNIPRELSDEYTAAQRSYAYTAGLMASDVFATAQNTLLNKFIAQATPAQKQSLIEASQTGDVSIGLQRTIQEKVIEDNTLKAKQALGEGKSTPNWLPLAILGGVLLLSGGLKW